MRRLLTLALCAAIALPAWAAKPKKPEKEPDPKPVAVDVPAPPAASKLPKLAFLGVNAGDSVSKDMSSFVEEMFLNALQKSKAFAIVGRSDVASLLGFDKQKQMLGCEADGSCAADIAGSLGAEYLGSASYGKLGALKIVSFKFLVVKTATVPVRAERRVNDEEQLPEAIDSMVREAVVAMRQETQPKEVAKDHLAMAKTLFTEGAFEDSVREWEATIAAAQPPKPELFLNLAQAARLADDVPKALENYRKFAKLAPAAPNAEEVQHFIADLENAKRPDRVGPHIEHAPPPAAPPGAPITLTARIVDPSGVFQPFLHYRLGADGRYNAIALLPLADDRFVAAIPAQETGEVHYFVEAFDSKGNGPVRHGTPSFPHVLPIRADAAPIAKIEVPPAATQAAVVAEAPKAVVVASKGRGPVAYATLAAAALVAGAGGFFGYQSSAAASKWKAAADYDTWVASRQGAYDAASRANTTFLAAGVLGAAGAGLFLFTEF